MVCIRFLEIVTGKILLLPYVYKIHTYTLKKLSVKLLNIFGGKWDCLNFLRNDNIKTTCNRLCSKKFSNYRYIKCSKTPSLLEKIVTFQFFRVYASYLLPFYLKKCLPDFKEKRLEKNSKICLVILNYNRS